ncbi:MAG: hypothetical protein KGQ32_02890 [Xanthomonadaceae bacterium]|nr:hypothetical protein [Xanthomonadaceae bacterium]
MRGRSRSDGGRHVRITVLAAGMLALAGCATGYTFMQPGGTGAGGYYTSDGPYPAPGYYYDDGLGAYDALGASFGYGSLYGPSLTFGLGFGSACGWSCAGYYDGWPWYYGGAGYHRWRRHQGRHHHGDPVATAPSPRPWLHPDHARVPPPNGTRGAAPPIAVPAPSLEGLASRRSLQSASFVPRGADGLPRPAAGLPERPATMAPQPPAFVGRPMPMRAATPHDFARPAAPLFAPPRAAPPPVRSSHATPDKIP